MNARMLQLLGAANSFSRLRGRKTSPLPIPPAPNVIEMDARKSYCIVQL